MNVVNAGGVVNFKCPVCRQIHVKAQYGGDEYVCKQTLNSRKQKKRAQNTMPTDIISRNAYNFNRLSTKEDRYDDIELTNVNKAAMDNLHRDFGGGKKGDNY